MEGQVMLDAVSVTVGVVTLVLILAHMFTKNKNNTLATMKVVFMVVMAILNVLDADIFFTVLWTILACLNIVLIAIRINTKSQ
ncbi:MAG: hypothetical protein ABIB61_02075 [Candidatus Shapirobacteria bacterium]